MTDKPLKHAEESLVGERHEVQVYGSVNEFTNWLMQNLNQGRVEKYLKGRDGLWDKDNPFFEKLELALGDIGLDRAKFIGQQFDSTEVWKKAVDTPDTDAIEKIEKMIDQIKDIELPTPISRKRRRKFDELDGDGIDYDRLRAGQPFWEKSERRAAPSPSTFTIICDSSTNWRQSPEDILWKGAAAVATTHFLEKAGYRAELWLVQYSKQNYTDMTNDLIAIRLKTPREPLNISSLSTAVAGWFYRTGIFAAKSMSCANRTAEYSLGYPNSLLRLDHIKQFTQDPNYIIVKAHSEIDAKLICRGAIEQVNKLQEKHRRIH